MLRIKSETFIQYIVTDNPQVLFCSFMRTEISENHDQYYDILICTVIQIAYYLGKYLLIMI